MLHKRPVLYSYFFFQSKIVFSFIVEVVMPFSKRKQHCLHAAKGPVRKRQHPLADGTAAAAFCADTTPVVSDETIAPLSTFQQRMLLLHHNENLFPITKTSDDDNAENIIIDKKTLKSLVAESF